MSNASTRDVLAISQLSDQEIASILSLANRRRSDPAEHQPGALAGKMVVQLFYEDSTRTRLSFQMAALGLGASVVDVPIERSAITKGESLSDMFRTIHAMHPDVVVLRHSTSGMAEAASRLLDAPVINAGDGCHEHPTQALLDAATIAQHFGSLKGLRIAICGDVLHSRVARSGALLFQRLGAEVHYVAPPMLAPALGAASIGVPIFSRLEEGIAGCDVIMMLRTQRERLAHMYLPSAKELFHYYGLTHERLTHAKPGVVVMHPGPMQREVEIASRLADDTQYSLISEQVSMGVVIRQAVLQWACGA